MARDAGFAMVANLSEGVINQIIAAFWANLVPPLPFNLPTVQIAGETITFQGAVQILPPTIALTPRPDNLIPTTLSVGGYFSYQIGSAEAVSSVIVLDATIAVGVTVVTAGKYLVPTLDLTNALVPSLGINVTQGPALPASVNQALNSPTVLGAVQTAIRAIPQSVLGLGASTIPNSITAQGVTANFGNVTVVPMAGYLAVAADLLGYTSGDASQLGSLIAYPAPTPVVWTNLYYGGAQKTGGGMGSYSSVDCNVAATINGPALLTFLNGPVATAICAISLPDGAEIDSVNFALTSYQSPLDSTWWPGLVVEASASESILSGSVTVDFAVFLVQAGGGPTYWTSVQPPPVWLVRADNVNISLSGVDYLVAVGAAAIVGGIVGFALAPVVPLLVVAMAVVLDTVVPNLISEFETEAQNAINAGIQNGSSFGSSLPYWNSGPLPGATNANWTVTTIGLAVSPAGFDSYANVVASATNGGNPSLSLTGAEDDQGNYIYSAVPQNWTLTVTIPTNCALNAYPTFLSQTDPSIHVGWSVTGPNINSAEFSSDELIATPGALAKAIDFNPNDPAFVHNNGLTITVSIYRLIGTQKWPIWSSSIATSIYDELDITQNYVHWNHLIYLSTASNKGTVRFYWYRNRKSVIHKTDRTARCKNVVTAAIAADKKGRSLTYIDTLPFPASDAEKERRGNLCDYCFFGGPHGTVFKP